MPELADKSTGTGGGSGRKITSAGSRSAVVAVGITTNINTAAWRGTTWRSRNTKALLAGGSASTATGGAASSRAASGGGGGGDGGDATLDFIPGGGSAAFAGEDREEFGDKDPRDENDNEAG